jgi:Na+-driven multidrug efflux pump
VTSPAPAPSRPRDPFRAVAAGICAIQALALLGFVGFYLWELTQDSSDDVARVVMSALLILVFAVGIGALARGWLRGDNWPNTPTVVWNALLLPVGWSLVQSDHGLIGALVIVIALLGIIAAIRADTKDRDAEDAHAGE